MPEPEGEIIKLLRQIAEDLRYLRRRAEEREQAAAEATEILQEQMDKDWHP